MNVWHWLLIVCYTKIRMLRNCGWLVKRRNGVLKNLEKRWSVEVSVGGLVSGENELQINVG